MCRILLLYEHESLGGPPGIVRSVARGAERAGAEVRMRTMADAGRQDIRWADALALAIGGNRLPSEVKAWLDALGFSGWRALRDKRGCVFTADPMREDGSVRAVRSAVHLLAARGMHIVPAGELGLEQPSADSDGAAIGHALATRLAERRPPAVARMSRTG